VQIPLIFKPYRKLTGKPAISQQRPNANYHEMLYLRQWDILMIHLKALIICTHSQDSEFWIESKQIWYLKKLLVPKVDMGEMVMEVAKRETVELCWWSHHQGCMIPGKSVLAEL